MTCHSTTVLTRLPVHNPTCLAVCRRSSTVTRFRAFYFPHHSFCSHVPVFLVSYVFVFPHHVFLFHLPPTSPFLMSHCFGFGFFTIGCQGEKMHCSIKAPGLTSNHLAFNATRIALTVGDTPYTNPTEDPGAEPSQMGGQIQPRRGF